MEALRGALRREGFLGELEDGLGTRQVAATDNSIYEVLPAAVCHPRVAADVNAAVRAGCCGMAGLSGHQAAHLDMSRRLFDLGWRRWVEDEPDTSLATGHSCRSQAGRMAGRRLRHPVEQLWAHLQGASVTPVRDATSVSREVLASSSAPVERQG